MRILSINVHYQDKLGYQDYFLGKELQKMGHEVHYISSDVHFDFPDYDRTVKHIIGKRQVGTGVFLNDFNAKVHRLKGTSKSKTGMIWLKGLKEKIDELKPDFIISHGILTWQSIRLTYYKDITCPIVFDDHTTINLIRKGYKSSVFFFIFRKLFSKRIEKRAKQLIGISDTCIQVMRDNFGLTGEKVKMIPLGTDTTLFKPNELLRNAFRKKLNLFEDEILITYTGKMYEEKKVHLIFDALNSIDIKDYTKIKILLVGAIAKDYEQVINDKINSSKFKVLREPIQSQEELASIYNATDIAVWPAHLTTSTIDASACGCPIICSHYMTERTKYKNGINIQNGSLAELKVALAKLISNYDLRKEMGNKGVEYVQNELSWAIIANRLIC